MSALDQRSPVPDIQALPDGTRVALRPVGPRDLDALRALAERAGIVCEELELARLVRSDPAQRLVLCATALDGERVLGIGVIELGHCATMPSLVLVDPAAGDGLGRAVAQALVDRARLLAASIVA
jgi:predicted N-acetyltransferase YhbS